MATKNVKTMYLSIESMAVLFPSGAEHSGETLPFVEIPEFEAFGESARLQSKASIIAFSPLLTSSHQLRAWNTYSSSHTNWTCEGHSIDSVVAIIHGSRSAVEMTGHPADQGCEGVNISSFVYKIDSSGRKVRETGSGPFSPIWEMTPTPNASVLNFNLASNELFAGLLNYTVVSKTPILSKPLEELQMFGLSAADNGAPVSALLQPVYDGFKHGFEHKVVGTVTALISWQEFFMDVSHAPVCKRNTMATSNNAAQFGRTRFSQ
jgi:hypothetical protein